MSEERIITAAVVTSGEKGDGPRLPELLEISQQNGMDVDTVIGDAAYSGKDNLKLTHQQGIKVVAHQQDSEDTARLVQAGVAGFLHGRFEDEISEDLSRLLAESQTFVIPNLGLSLLRRMTIAEDPLLYETLPAPTLSRLANSCLLYTSPSPRDS